MYCNNSHSKKKWIWCLGHVNGGYTGLISLYFTTQLFHACDPAKFRGWWDLRNILICHNMNFPGGGGVVKIRDPQKSLSLSLSSSHISSVCVDMHEMNNCKINVCQKYRRLDYILGTSYLGVCSVLIFAVYSKHT